MSQHPTNVLLVGLGNIGYSYDAQQLNKTWTHYRAITSNVHFNLVAAIESNEESLQRFVRETGHAGFSSVAEFTETLEEQVDMVVIATPTETHLELFQQTKSLQPKILLIEKPLVSKGESYAELDRFEGKIFVNLIRLYHPLLAEFIDRVKAGGRCEIFINCSKGLLHNGIHFLSLLMKTFGKVTNQKWSNLGGLKQLQVEFESAVANFRETNFGLDDNSMILQSKSGTLYYLNGGRKCFFIDSLSSNEDLPGFELDHYQKGIYDACANYLNGDGSDESYELAKRAQLILEGGDDL